MNVPPRYAAFSYVSVTKVRKSKKQEVTTALTSLSSKQLPGQIFTLESSARWEKVILFWESAASFPRVLLEWLPESAVCVCVCGSVEECVLEVEWVMSGPWADSLFSAAVNHTPSLTEEQCSGLYCTLYVLHPTLQAAHCLFLYRASILQLLVFVPHDHMDWWSLIHSLTKSSLTFFLPHRWCFTSLNCTLISHLTCIFFKTNTSQYNETMNV